MNEDGAASPLLLDRVVSGNTDETRPANRAYFPALDGVRAFALLLVFCGHYLHWPWGWAGVDFFFVLSGFLITGILYDTREAAHRLRDFYLRRVLRIFPLYYGLLIALVLMTPIFHWKWSGWWWVWPTYMGNFIRFVEPYSTDVAFWDAANGNLVASGRHLTTFHLGHFWSLCLEEQFYLVWPAIVFAAKSRKQLIQICAVVVVLSPIARTVALWLLPLRYEQLEITYSFTPFRLDGLLLGGLIALLLRGPEQQRLIGVFRNFGRVALPASLVYLVWAIAHHANYAYPPGRLTWGLSCVDLVAAALIVCSLRPGSVVYRIFSVRCFRWAGKVSYGAYVFHDIPHAWYVRWAPVLFARVPTWVLPAGARAALLAAACTLFLAWLSFRVFESRFLSLKTRFPG